MAKKTGNHSNGMNNGNAGNTDSGVSNTNAAGYAQNQNSNYGDSKTSEDTTN